MTVCLQGGGELSPGCRRMDEQLLVGLDGPVVIASLASEPGWQYDTTNGEGVSHFRTLGAVDVVGAPDVRSDPAGALSALRTARLIVLPGGSPSRLLSAVTDSPVGQLVLDLIADGGSVMGASAGAMVLGAWTVLPDRRAEDGGLAVARGLGAAPYVVIPHWSGGSSRGDWLRATSGLGVEVLGLPEESGVLLHDGQMAAAGQHATRLLSQDRDLAVGETA